MEGKVYGKVDIKVYAKTIDDKAREQLAAISNHPAFQKAKIRIMPDVHAGAGCVIGFTARNYDKVIPNLIGVDIGCGVRVWEMGKIDLDLKALDEFIKSDIPCGLGGIRPEDQRGVDEEWLEDNLVCYRYLRNIDAICRGIGSLGGGNHFIEVDEDDEGNKYLVVHTGSRNLGSQVANHYQSLAVKRLKGDAKKASVQETIERMKAEGRQSEIQATLAEIFKEAKASDLPDDLCYLEGFDAKDYLHDVGVCTRYANYNRVFIISRIRSFLLKTLPLQEVAKIKYDQWESIHNYIAEDGTIRKGAISAKAGKKVIIPLNMRDGSIIGIGKGNPDWNESAPHGAGRLMSRAEARRSLTVEDFHKAMEGIYTSTADESTIDEAPMAYKDASDILSVVGDAVEVSKVIRPIYNFKAPEGEKPWAKEKEEAK